MSHPAHAGYVEGGDRTRHARIPHSRIPLVRATLKADLFPGDDLSVCCYIPHARATLKGVVAASSRREARGHIPHARSTLKARRAGSLRTVRIVLSRACGLR